MWAIKLQDILGALISHQHRNGAKSCIQEREVDEENNTTFEKLRACSFLYLFRFRNTNRSENTRSFCVTGIVFRFWFINQTRAGLPWFMSVYRRREPDNSSKLLGDTTTNKWVGIFFYAGTSTFSFLSLSSWAAWKTIFCALAFVEVPPQPLVPHLSHHFSLWQGRLSTQQPLSISCW